MSQTITIPGPGDRIAERYEVLEELGRGSYGVVFRARQTNLNREVAVKTLLPQSFLDEEVIERFSREAQLVSRLRHPNIIELYDYGQHNGLIYMVVEYVEGRSLSDLMRDDAPIKPAEALMLVQQILSALGHAHEQGIVHRDLKPDNILLLKPDPKVGRHHETVKVLDFGIAKLVQREGQDYKTLTQAGHVLGTPHYMSPEQIVGDAVDHRSDLYAIGVILYELLSGKHPFDAQNSTAVMVRHLRDDAPPLPFGLEQTEWGATMRAALAKQPHERIPDAKTFLEMLTRTPPPVQQRAMVGHPTPLLSLGAVRVDRSSTSSEGLSSGFDSEPTIATTVRDTVDDSMSALPTLNMGESERVGWGDEDPTDVYTNVPDQLHAYAQQLQTAPPAAIAPGMTASMPTAAVAGGEAASRASVLDEPTRDGSATTGLIGLGIVIVLLVASLWLWRQHEQSKRTTSVPAPAPVTRTVEPPRPTRPGNPTLKETTPASAAKDMGAPVAAPDMGASEPDVASPKTPPETSTPPDEKRPRVKPRTRPRVKSGVTTRVQPKVKPRARTKPIAKAPEQKAEKKGTVTIIITTSNPKQASVSFNGTPMGMTPLTHMMKRGHKPIKVTIKSFGFAEKKLVITPDKDVKLTGLKLRNEVVLP